MKKFFKGILKHKKPIIIFSLAAVICTAVYTDYLTSGTTSPLSDYLYTSNVSDTSTKILGEAKLVDKTETIEDSSPNYFDTASINRERSRDEALQTLQVVVDSAETMPDVKDKALSEMMQIASDIETETNVEEMIKAKGFTDCVAIISGEKINVIVKTPGLLTAEVAQITEIVMNETGKTPDQINIVESSGLLTESESIAESV